MIGGLEKSLITAMAIQSECFCRHRRKILSLKHVQPIKIECKEADNAMLDNLKITKSTNTLKYQSITQSIQSFLKEFPGGFYSEKFKEHERDYKEKPML